MNSIVYNSSLIIDDKRHLSTLCVFYDCVYLPCFSSPDVVQFSQSYQDPSKYIYKGRPIFVVFNKGDDRSRIHREYVTNWDEPLSSLFAEGVISRLDSSQEITNGSFFDLEENTLNNILLEFPGLLHSHTDYKSYIFYVDHLIHLLRTDVDSPGVYLAKNNNHNRDILKSLLAQQSFSYLLPKLQNLEPDQILEVRRKIKDTREGFSYHLQALSGQLYSATVNKEPLDEIISFAKNIVETQIVPDYYEFCRQLKSSGNGWWSRVLDAGGDILEIDSAPWTPKFYKQLGSILGGIISKKISETLEDKTNKKQAFKFIRTIENRL